MSNSILKNINFDCSLLIFIIEQQVRSFGHGRDKFSANGSDKYRHRVAVKDPKKKTTSGIFLD